MYQRQSSAIPLGNAAIVCMALGTTRLAAGVVFREEAAALEARLFGEEAEGVHMDRYGRIPPTD